MEPEKHKIVAYNIVKIGHYAHGHQYAVKLKLDNGELITKRLPGLFPTKNNFNEEPMELQNKAHLAVFNLLQSLHDEGPRPSGKYKTCREAMAAYEEWHGLNRRCDKRKFHYLCKKFYDHYGDAPITDINDVTAQEFIEKLIDHPYGYDTVRLVITTASGMIAWLKDERLWPGLNPFSTLLKRYANRFMPEEPENPRFEEMEWEVIMRAASAPEYRTARIFIEVARCTGLRPSEICRLDMKHIDRQKCSWTVFVTKKAGRPMYRKIAVPQHIITYLDNEGITGALPLVEITVARQIRKLSGETSIKFTAKTFRKDFACRMEEAGADESIINVHQWRGQTGTLYKNYIKFPDRAVKLCRPYINLMFGEKTRLVRAV